MLMGHFDNMSTLIQFKICKSVLRTPDTCIVGLARSFELMLPLGTQPPSHGPECWTEVSAGWARRGPCSRTLAPPYLCLCSGERIVIVQRGRVATATCCRLSAGVTDKVFFIENGILQRYWRILERDYTLCFTMLYSIWVSFLLKM